MLLFYLKFLLNYKVPDLEYSIFQPLHLLFPQNIEVQLFLNRHDYFLFLFQIFFLICFQRYLLYLFAHDLL